MATHTQGRKERASPSQVTGPHLHSFLSLSRSRRARLRWRRIDERAGRQADGQKCGAEERMGGGSRRGAKECGSAWNGTARLHCTALHCCCICGYLCSLARRRRRRRRRIIRTSDIAVGALVWSFAAGLFRRLHCLARRERGREVFIRGECYVRATGK